MINLFPLDGGSTLRPTIVMVYGWVGGKHVYVDLTESHHLLDWDEGFYGGTNNRHSRVKQNDQTCSDKHVFSDIVFATFNFLTPKLLTLNPFNGYVPRKHKNV